MRKPSPHAPLGKARAAARFFACMAAVCALLLPLRPAVAQTLRVEDVLTLEYPNDWCDFGADNRYDEENSYYNLAFIGGAGDTDLCLSIDLCYYEEYADIRLFSSDAQIVDDFAGWLLEGGDGALLEIRQVSPYRIPFVVLENREDGGTVLYADTMTNGWDLTLSAYACADANSDALRPLTDAERARFLEILDSLEPLLN